jgi:urease accessory protein
VILVEETLGNADEPTWAARIASGSVDSLSLDHWEAQKNRLRKKTDGGLELAISLDRGAFLRDGDVLVWDEPASRVVVARIKLREVMVVHLDELAATDPAIAWRTCLEIGHALGNQHWPALVKGTCVYVPLTIDRQVMASVMKTHRFEGIRLEFVPGGDVVPYLAPHEARRLFGGAESPVRPEGHTPSHTHSHPHAHSHSHAHPDTDSSS